MTQATSARTATLAGPTPLMRAADAAFAPGTPSIAYRNYLLGVIWLVLLLRFVDIQIVAVLLESMRAEFKVSDTQLGLLSGTAFALFYGALGVPIAWLSDRYSRRNIVAACLGLWSAMSMLCGMAGSFFTLFLARMGVGFGEAGGVPPTYSLVCDYVPASRRSTVFAFLNTAVPAGVFAGYLVGGTINARLGWRATLIIIGLAGVLLAALVKLTVREPRRGIADGLAAAEPAPSTLATLRYLWNLRSYRHFVLASSVFTLGMVGSGMWLVSFFIRVHNMQPLAVSTWLAFVYGGGGLVGAMLGGVVADRLARNTGDRRWQAWLPACCAFGTLPIVTFVYLWSNPITALLVHTTATVLMHAWLGPTYATVQSLAGVNRRAMAAAINLLVVNVLALGFGPLIVGAMSDSFSAHFGAQSLRYSILSLSIVCFAWAGVHFVLAGRTVRQDLSVSLPATAA